MIAPIPMPMLPAPSSAAFCAQSVACQERMVSAAAASGPAPLARMLEIYRSQSDAIVSLDVRA